MKVLYITPEYPREKGSPSSGKVKELVLAMRKSGIDLRVAVLNSVVRWPFSMLNHYSYMKVVSQNDELWTYRQQVKILPRRAGVIFKASGWARMIRDNIAERWPDFRPDVIHGRTFIPGGLVACRLAEMLRCPLVISTHGADTHVYTERFLGRREIIRLSNRADAVVCVGKSVVNKLLRCRIPQKKLRVVYNGTNISKVFGGHNHIAEKYRDKLVVLGVGNLYKSKGFDFFIQAIQQLRHKIKNIHGIIVGGGGDRQRLERMIRECGLNDVIKMTGALSNAETMAYMDACDIFCLPSWSEGFGIVYAEAMAHCKPVIAVDGEGIFNIIKKHNAGLLVRAKNSGDVAEAIEKLAENPAAASEMGLNGRAAVEDMLTWDHCAQNMKELYRSVMKGEPVRR